jgi:hypothetical protein
MALSYNSIAKLATNEDLKLQISAALLKQAYTRIIVGGISAGELALCQAVIKSPTSYAPRFLLDALIVNAAGLTSSDGGTTLNAAVPDATFDTVVAAQWNAQILAGV